LIHSALALNEVNFLSDLQRELPAQHLPLVCSCRWMRGQ